MELTNTLLILAGPNGSGKSYISRKIQRTFPDLDYISPDDLATAIYADVEDQGLRHYQYAAPETERVILEAIRKHKTIALETVLSSDHKWHLFEAARHEGMTVRSVFIATCDVKINVGRVARRAAQGGHNVPESKIISRYAKSLQRLGRLINQSDECIVYDNSVDGIEPVLVLWKIHGSHYVIQSDDTRFLWLYELLNRWMQESACPPDHIFYVDEAVMADLEVWKHPNPENSSL